MHLKKTDSNSITRRQWWYLVLLLAGIGMILLLVACTLDPIRENPQDALTIPPGRVHPNYRDSIQILQQQTIDNGIVLLYRWQTDAAATAATFCIASAFLSYGAAGWQVESGGNFVGDTVSEPACNLAHPILLKASYYYAGQTTTFTMIYGLSDSGKNVRITWSDFQTSVVPVDQGTFLVPREGEFMPQRIEVLDDSGNSVAEEVW